MKNRISLLLSREGLPASKFAEILNIQPSGVSHILSGRNKPGYDLIVKILTSFPHVSSDWLILGTGEMYRDKVKDSESHNARQSEDDDLTVSEEVETFENLSETLFDMNAIGPGNKNNCQKKQVNSITDSLQVRRKSRIEIEKVMIFYSDKTVTSYELKQ